MTEGNLEDREVILTVRELNNLRLSFEPDHKLMIELYKESAGYGGMANYESFCAYRYLRNYPRKFQWRTQADVVNQRNVCKAYKQDFSPYESASMEFAQSLRRSFEVQTSAYEGIDPLTRLLTHGAFDRVKWEEVSEALLQYARTAKTERKRPFPPGLKVVHFPQSPSSSLIRRRQSHP